MPQNVYPLKIGDSTTILVDVSHIPGFDTLGNAAKDSLAKQIFDLVIARDAVEPATFSDFAIPIICLIAFALLILWIAKKISRNPKLYDTIVKMDGEPNPEYGNGWRQQNSGSQSAPAYLTYPGNKLTLTFSDYAKILSKYSPYYNQLRPGEKERFIQRLMHFISKKTFFIHANEGYTEMPVLTSACAIQLSFGLEKFEMPAYPHIHIHPKEFLRTNPDICFLEGSVSGYSIYLSWKHVLQGDQLADGQHVGLHEMAHAYHCQNFEKGVDTDPGFVKHFPVFNDVSRIIFNEKVKNGSQLYSVHALKNFQEFWAETIEIYFEKPLVLKNKFPELYESVSTLLNQDHASRVPAV